MKVVFSAEAIADLEEIGDYIAKDSPRRARTFLAELRDASLDIAHFPEKFQLVPRYERDGLRRRPHGAYLIFYTIEPEFIAVVHILHGAQDYEAILAPPG